VDPAQPELKDSLQAAVRYVADEYLRDPNITSVGIGYKTVDGQRTDQLAFQFTVGQKLGLEDLAGAATRPIPQELTAGGITLPTDVVEREFAPHPVAVEPEAKSIRKRRLDPMKPGIGIGHIDNSGGTLGCLVEDAATGDLRILSNWHVLSGAGAHPGDTIVQPCRFDDDRVDQNHAGTLVRSHLGLGGDSAIARPAGRAVEEAVLELDVGVRRIGDPALDDLVVKSGRTSGITYGRVTRLHTITKLVYPGVGETQIGGFEVGPDPDHPAENGEISMPGDSGSVWFAVDGQGRATDMMVGLHFAGELIEPAEWAAACYASAVFSKLEIRPLRAAPPPGVLAAAPEAAPGATAAGYDPDFLRAFTVPIPTSTAGEDDYAPTRSAATVRHYTHFSLAMSRSRRFAHWVAWNIDGASIRKLSRKGIGFVLDAEYEEGFQTGAALYEGNHLDQGHIARRADLVWGLHEEADQANRDSFFFTNITPQLDRFNRSAMRGLWGELENAIFDDVAVDDLRISLIGGPLFAENDFVFESVAIPRSFFKIVAWVENGELKAKAFVLTQKDLETGIEALGLEEFKVYQLPVAQLREVTRLDFGVLETHDVMKAAPEALGSTVRRIDRPEDFFGEA
jgi:endonuclease G, mitochondrial